MVWVLFLVVLLSSCAQPEPQISVKSPLEERYGYQLNVVKGYIVAGDFNRARIEAVKLLKIKRTPEAYNLLGLAYMGLGEMEEAERAFRMAVKLDDGYSTAWTNLSACYLKKGRYEEALRAASMALANPMYMNPEKAYLNMAEAYFGMGKDEEALRALEKAIRYNVGFAPAYERLLKYYVERGEIGEAKNVLYDAEAAGVDSPGVNFYKALILIREGKVLEAKAILKGILRDYPLTTWAKRALEYLESIE